MRLSTLLNFFLIVGLALAMTACDDDDDDDNDDTSQLPNGGTASSPVGRYVAVISADGFVLPPTTEGWDTFAGETTAVSIDNDLNLIVDGDTEATLSYDAAEDWYRGVETETDGSATITTTYTVSYDTTANEWQTRVGIQIDSDSDGTTDEGAVFTALMKPRVDWSVKAGTWQVAVLSTDGDTGAVIPMIRQAQIGAEGTLIAGSEDPVAFYNDDGTLRAQAYVSEYDEIYQWAVSTNQSDLMVFALTIKEVPATITDPDPSGYADGDTIAAHAIPLSRLADFVVSDYNVTVASQSTTDVDGDGSDGYFGGTDMTGQTIPVSLDATGTFTAQTGDPTDPTDTRSYGYLQGGLLIAPLLEGDGTYNDLSIITMEVDSNSDLTGDGRLDGYDFPDDGDGEISDTEFEQMDDAGVLVFGNGIPTTGLDYVGLQSVVPAALSAAN